ncbi:MAG: hypoxanthine phosphoribosyltransferase [Bacteroidetes bacterium]|nr:hypoxanthine phosphoribosyltransferase [Bacteroidota bacterium]MBM3425231.1 hypoxanthine phosphoribosyltransferase [Bacteroidota bacterium]
METIKLHDRTFSPYLSAQEIQDAVVRLAEQINNDYRGKDLLFLSVLNGSFMFTSDLMKHIILPCEISFMKVSSYQGTESTGRVDELIGLNSQVLGKHIVLLEDVVDTGVTIDKIIRLLQTNNPESVEVCSILFKKEAHIGQNRPKYFGFEIPNKFVVGYGLDYNQHGRNLPSIYQLKT